MTNDIVLDSLKTALLGVVADEKSAICESVYQTIKESLYRDFQLIPQIHVIKTVDKTVTTKEVLHEKFEEVLQMVSLNIPVYLTGKAGVGKNVICMQIAKTLGLDFYFSNAITQEYKLTGFIDANGIYQDTQFYKAFTQGGLFFLDEIDASIPEVLVILNAAIANGYFDFPTGKVEAHPNFHVIAAGNTVGMGANNIYTGRYCLDRASLDRFALIEIDYSRAIEESMAKGKEDLINFAHAFRKAAEEAGVDILCSYRAIQRIATLEEVMDDLHEVLEVSLIKGLCKDDIQTMCNNIGKFLDPNKNKYVKALAREGFQTEHIGALTKAQIAEFFDRVKAAKIPAPPSFEF